MFASCTSTWLEQMFDFQKYTRLLISSPQGRQQRLSLGADPIYNAVPCFPHDNSVGIRLCDECKKSVLLIFFHMLLSIWWLISQASWPTTECQVVQFVPGTSISRQFVSKLLTILQQTRVRPAWIDKDLKLCKVAPLSCLPVHSTARRNFWACPSTS